MYKRFKRNIFAGPTCDTIVYTAPVRNGVAVKSRQRFKSEEERAEHRRLIARRHCAQLVNENISTSGYYCTLTFDNDNEVHTMEEAKKVRTNFRRRVLYRNPDAVLFIFMGRGKGTDRIHFHVICDHVTKEDILLSWRAGKVVTISPIREHNKDEHGNDIGRDLTGISNYCFDHWTPEQGGHYYSRTDNVRQPVMEEPEEVTFNYTETIHPAAPRGFKYISVKQTPYGMLIYHYVKLPKPKPRR